MCPYTGLKPSHSIQELPAFVCYKLCNIKSEFPLPCVSVSVLCLSQEKTSSAELSLSLCLCLRYMRVRVLAIAELNSYNAILAPPKYQKQPCSGEAYLYFLAELLQ